MDQELRLESLRAACEKLRPHIVRTPAQQWVGPGLPELQAQGTTIFAKLEPFQYTGTFKARGALNTVLSLSAAQRARGVTALSAGNHAIATAWAAAQIGINAKVLMPESANPYRVQLARDFGADIVFAPSHHAMFEMITELVEKEGRTFVHPFEGPLALQGSASAALEFCEQLDAPVDVMILPVGGGGLCAGFSAALKQLWPDTVVYGVEPEGANVMYRSFQSGKPETLASMNSIADSLSPPKTEPYTFGVCRELVSEIVLVSDDELREAMRRVFSGLKLAVEPAGAASTAALLGPLRERCAGKRVGIMVCGANIDRAGFCALTA